MPPHHVVKLSGKISDIFGHRVVVETGRGKVLADLGPKSAKTISLNRNEKVELEGEEKPTEIKVHRIAVSGRPAIDLTVQHKRDDHHDDENPGFSIADARHIADRNGFKIIGELTPHKRHYEGTVEHNGSRHDIHLHRDHVMIRYDLR